MNKLLCLRLSDQPGNVREFTRKNPASRVTETVVIFTLNGRLFTYSGSPNSSIQWIAELGPFSKEGYPASTGNPGGHPVLRLELVWKHRAIQMIKEFLAE